MKIQVYLKTKDGANASAVYDSLTKTCEVKKDSIVTPSISQAPTFRSKGIIRKKRDEYVKDRIVIKNVMFRSSSTASNFVTGRSTDGMLIWRDKNGKKLKDLLI